MRYEVTRGRASSSGGEGGGGGGRVINPKRGLFIFCWDRFQYYVFMGTLRGRLLYVVHSCEKLSQIGPPG